MRLPRSHPASPRKGVDDVTTLLHSTCYQTPVRFWIRRHPTARGDHASETASLGGKMAYVSDPRHGGGGGGPKGQTGAGGFRELVGGGSESEQLSSSGTHDRLGLTRPMRHPRRPHRERALEDPCKGSSRSSPTPGRLGLPTGEPRRARTWQRDPLSVARCLHQLPQPSDQACGFVDLGLVAT